MARLGRPLPGRLLLGAAVPWWRRSRWRIWRWAAALGLAALTVAVVRAQLDEAAAVVSGLGTTRRVAVARHDLEPGHVVTDADVEVRDLPVAAVPESALHEPPAGRTVTSPIVTGEVVSSQRLAPDGVHGLAALVPAGRRAIAVPTGEGALPLAVGDRVDVLDAASGDRYAGDYADDAAASGAVVASGAAVIAVDDRSVTVVVDADETRAIAAALARGTPVLALSGPVPDD